MSLKDVFCNSPWFHYILDENGEYRFCCWSHKSKVGDYNIKTHTEDEFMNSNEMKNIRLALLNGDPVEHCQSCYRNDHLKQISGRLRQLDKSAIKIDFFDKSLIQSPHLNHFKYTASNNGAVDTKVNFIKVNLGNTCNGACIYCFPKFSKKLETEFKKIGFFDKNSIVQYIEPQGTSFVDDPAAWQRFVDSIVNNPHLQFLQILGGEPLYEKKFWELLDILIETGRAKTLHLGVTTNCTIWDERLPGLLDQFFKVDLGLSVDTIDPVNDYVRWPSKIDIVVENIKKFAALRNERIYVLIRPSPNIFSIYHFDKLFEFCLELELAQETSFVFQDPSWLRIEMLPRYIRGDIIDRLVKLKNKDIDYNFQHLNIRNRKDYWITNFNNLDSYINLLQEEQKLPLDDAARLVNFLHRLENSRGNNILTYLPNYETFLKSIGY